MAATKLNEPYLTIVYGHDAAWADHYGTKFKARRAVALHALNQGWTLADMRRVFLDHRNPGSVLWLLGSDDRPLSLSETTKRLDGDYRAAYSRYQESKPYSNGREVRQEVSILLALVKDSHWPGRSGRTDKAVFTGILNRMIEIGSTKINYSIRDAGLDAGVLHTTAGRSLTRLVKLGLLSKSKSYGNEANEFKLVCHYDTYNLFKGESYMVRNDTPNDHECWLRLGKASADIYRVLTDKPMSARAIAKAAHVGNKTASRNLPKLREYELATQTDDGWIIGRLSPDEVVDAFGWKYEHSKSDARKRLVDEDRETRKRVQKIIRETRERDYQQMLKDYDPDNPWTTMPGT